MPIPGYLSESRSFSLLVFYYKLKFNWPMGFYAFILYNIIEMQNRKDANPNLMLFRADIFVEKIFGSAGFGPPRQNSTGLRASLGA